MIKHTKPKGKFFSGSAESSFSYSGDLEECINKAKKEANQKRESEERTHIKWEYERAKKQHENYEQKIKDLDDFARLAKKQIEKEKEDKAGDQK